MPYFVFEGIDGCGKTTQVNDIVRGPKMLATKEPGAGLSPTCIDIRKVLLHNTPKEQMTMGYLFLADAFEHMSTVVKPHLELGYTVVSDRCLLSDFAYRPDFPSNLRVPVIDLFLSLRPVIIHFDVSPDVARDRMESGGRSLNQYEREQVVHRMHDLAVNYARAADYFRGMGVPVIIIDADLDKDAVRTKLQDIMEEYA